MRLSTFVVLAVLGISGCALNRAPILPGSDAGPLLMDTGSLPDVPIAPGIDAPSIEIDAPTGCAASCGVGERCEGTTCICAADLCAGDRACIAGACTVCGGPSETCCPDVPCRDGGACGGENRCPASRCDRVGDPCCAGDRCDGLMCSAGTCVTPCGGERQDCCATGDACRMWLSCRVDWDLSRRCLSCGGLAEPCCSGACEGGMRCNGLDFCTP